MTHDLRDRICIVVASNSDEVLNRNLLASPLVAAGVPVEVVRGAPSAAVAYNRGLDATVAPLVIFAHQDVYLPAGWEARLARALAAVEARDPDWALIGPYGVRAGGGHVGHVWSTSLGRALGETPAEPQPVESFDELLLVMRRDAGLRFDEALPLWHLYGTDIVQAARAAGRGAHVADLACVHNDGFHGRLGADFGAAYDFLRRKWAARLPVWSPIVRLDRFGLGLPAYRLRAWRSLERRRAMALDPGSDPRLFARRCGWEPTA